VTTMNVELDMYKSNTHCGMHILVSRTALGGCLSNKHKADDPLPRNIFYFCVYSLSNCLTAYLIKRTSFGTSLRLV
jgi:hypothetical protein